jgi:threonylcarbamoyladenosine tRNA methylthiotransferase MtaB
MLFPKNQPNEGIKMSPKKTVSIQTMGCRLNFSESGSIIKGFADRGYEVVEFGTPADLVFMNTCTVTDGADSSAKVLIRKAIAQSPEAKIVVAGCFAQMESEEVKKIPGVDLILGNSEKFKVFEYLDNEDKVIVKLDHQKDFWGAATSLEEGHTRAFLKIQDGCNYICSFCIIPFARGRSRTITIKDAVKQAHELMDNGFKEIILTGVNIGEYENTSGERLVDLVSALLKIPKLERLRLSSVEPNTISEELLKVLAQSGKYQHHFHLPLQSGSGRVLKSMRRKYDTDYYKKTVALIHEYFPNASIGADIIAGYPGETEEEFIETQEFLLKEAVTHFHVFPYSKRKGTTASKLDGQIHTTEKRRRVKALIQLGEKKLEQYAEKFLHETASVLFEDKDQQGYWRGYSSHFLRAHVKSTKNLKNHIAQVKVTSVKGGQLFGELLDDIHCH